ncbi:MAG: hypothetical protein J0L99_04370 [Chitinophagales bacterium]|nr:hypothetical protein [Chitinophagales bacterium]
MKNAVVPQILLIALSALSLVACHTAEHALIPQKHQLYIPQSAIAFQATTSELRSAEKLLRRAFAARPGYQDWKVQFRLRDYRRQFYAYTNAKGEKIIFAQCIIKSWADQGDWRSFFFQPDDGCDGIFRVYLNLTLHTYSDFQFGTCA